MTAVPTRDPARPGNATFTVMTYNSHGGRDELGRPAQDQQADEIAAVNPDVLLLQEVDVGTFRSGQVNQAALLSALLDLPHVAFAAAMVHDGGLYGNAVLSRYPISRSHSIPFRAVESADVVHVDDKLRRWPEKAEPRCACLATVDFPDGQQLAVAAAHLSIFPQERARAAADLLSVLPPGPVVVGADLNTGNLDEPTWRTLLSQLHDLSAGFPSHRQPTYPASDPAHAIDALFGRHVEAVDARRVPTRATDHYAVVASVRFPCADR